MRRLLILSVLALVGCGGNPNSPSNFAQIAGTWSGTFEASNWTTDAVVFSVNQTTDAISGTWSTNNITGTVSGTVNKSSFTGTFTFSTPSTTGGSCTGNASVNGSAGSSTMRWTSVLFTGNCTGLPRDVVFTVQRR